MSVNRERLALTAILVVITSATLITSYQHHKAIAVHYGPVANIFTPLIAISAFLIGAFISLLFQWGVNVLHFEQIVKLLPKNEGEVMNLLFARRLLTQVELAAETGLSKSMISRVISQLEAKGVIIKTILGNTNLIESKIYRMHTSTRVLTRLPGLSEKRLAIVIFLVLLFGISLSILNSFHIIVLEHPLKPPMYLLAIEFLALGGLMNIILRKRISESQFERMLGILPEDERKILRLLYPLKTITQKELVEETGIYKMKVSRVLNKFQQRGIIETRAYGYTNLIKSRI